MMSEGYSREHRRARKPHVCTMCGRTIAVGETYLRGANFFDGTARSWNECVHCDALFAFIVAVGGESEYTPEDAFDWDSSTEDESVVIDRFRAQWTADGVLHPVPALISETVRVSDDFSYERITGIRAEAA